jgi:hypothetical protein
MKYKSFFDSIKLQSINSQHGIRFISLLGDKWTISDVVRKAEAFLDIRISSEEETELVESAKIYSQEKKESQREETKAKQRENKRKDRLDSFGEEDIGLDIAKHVVPIVNLENDRIIFYHKLHRKIEKINQMAYRVSKALSKEEFEKELDLGLVRYDPLNKDTMNYKRDSFGRRYIQYNTYQSPVWVEQIPTDSNIEDNIYYKLLTNALKDKESTEYLLDWIHNCRHSKCETAVFLVGTKGSGKSLIGQTVSQYVGTKNYARINDSLFNEKFNEQLFEKQFGFGDELSLSTTKELNYFKNYMNPEFSKDGKNDKVTMERNHISFMVASNDPRGTKPVHDDRRMSFIEPRENNINTILSKSVLKKIADQLKTISNEKCPQEMVDFFHWMDNREPKHDPSSVYKGDYFYKIVIENLDPSEKFIMNTLITTPGYLNPSIKYSDLKTLWAVNMGKNAKGNRELDKIPFIGIANLKKFVTSFKYYEREIIGNVVKRDDDFYLEINPGMFDLIAEKHPKAVEEIIDL